MDRSKDWQIGLEGNFQQMKLQDCVYFLRTGNCAFGSKCRYNHPMAEKPHGIVPNINMDELPDRPGQMECQFFIKTGTCKFGPACWYHHPQPKSGGGQLQLNFLGLPLRPGEKDCTFYVQTGSCKYGSTCRFHHPQPTSADNVLTSPKSSMFSPSNVATPASVAYQEAVTAWPIARAPYIPLSTEMPRPVNFMPLLVPQATLTTGSAPVKQQGQSSPMPPAIATQAAPQSISYGHSHGHFATSMSVKGLDSSQSMATFLHGQATFPERPGQPDCHHYMKTGDCKFGTYCKFHHPKDRAMSLPCSLNPLGLPCRPGKPACPYYVTHGICKFGPVCKFDHPVNVVPSSLPYSPSLSSLNEIPVVPSRSQSSSASPNSSSPERPQNSITSADDGSQQLTSDKPDVKSEEHGEHSESNYCN